MKELARAILSNEEDILTCEQCDQQIEKYVEASFDKVELESFKDVRIHLEQCPRCAKNYAELYMVAELATMTEIKMPSNKPEFDLSFLEPKTDIPTIINKWGHLIIKFSRELLQPRNPISYATVAVRSDELALSVDSSDSNYNFTMEIDGKRLVVIVRREDLQDTPEKCTIIVEIDTPEEDDWIDWEGKEIVLRRQGREIYKQHTDPFGQAIFENVIIQDLQQLQVDIQLEDAL